MANTIDSMGDQATLDGLISHTLTEFVDDSISNIRADAFKNNEYIKSVSLPSLTNIGGNIFDGCTELENVNIGSVLSLPSYAFNNCNKLKSLDISTVTTINTYSFSKCHSLNELDCSNISQIGSYAFDYSGLGQMILPNIRTLSSTVGRSPRISTIDIGTNYSGTLSSSYFSNSTSLYHLILRREESIVRLQNINALSYTPISRGLGWIYVPSDLVNAYQTASNWSNYSNQIVSISEYPKAIQDETITDTWDDIITSVNNGTYSTKYNIGDIKYCNIGGTYVPMQIVAFDTDILANSGVSHITFISRGAITVMTMYDAWENCNVREILQNVIYPQIENTVKNAIKQVTKTYLNASRETLSTTDTVWIPSAREIYGNVNFESTGVDYTSYFTDSNARKKYLGSSISSTSWYLRSGNSSPNGNHTIVQTSGNTAVATEASGVEHGIVIGFCI